MFLFYIVLIVSMEIFSWMLLRHFNSMDQIKIKL